MYKPARVRVNYASDPAWVEAVTTTATRISEYSSLRAAARALIAQFTERSLDSAVLALRRAKQGHPPKLPPAPKPKPEPCYQRARRKAKLRTAYGLTLENFDIMWAKQQGICPICLVNPAKAVDHEKATGYIRGLLCTFCNLFIGQANHDINRLSRAIIYLSQPRHPQTKKEIAAAALGETLVELPDDPE